PGHPLSVWRRDTHLRLRGRGRHAGARGGHPRRGADRGPGPDGARDRPLRRRLLRGGELTVPFPDRLDIPEDVLEIARVLEDAGHAAWCVGGAIRDTLLGEPNSDYDIATAARPDEVQRLFRHVVAVGERFGTVAVRT